MGRYTSIQTFSDQSTKVISNNSSSSSNDTSNNTNNTNNSNNNVNTSKITALAEKVDNVQSSSAGAGSDQFYIYQNARSREMKRLEDMEEIQRIEIDKAAFKDKVERNKRQADDKTSKNAAKRRKRKELKEKGRLIEKQKEKQGVEQDNKTQDT